MLCELTITNFAIIDRLRLTLAPGFTVLTGETGAGKSIIVDAIDALLGGRYGAEFVRSGADSGRIEGVFRVGEMQALPAGLAAVLTDYGLEPEEGQIILSREIHSSGRTAARINGRTVPTSVLQAVGQRLVDIHGQSEHLSLLRVGEHLNFLDRYGDLVEARRRVAERVAELRSVRRELQALMADEREVARRMDLLRYQIDEIAAARVREGEDEELQRERTLLSNAEKLAALSEAAYAALYDGADDQRAVIDLLGQVGQALAELTRLDPSLAGSLRIATSAAEELAELAHSLRAYRDAIEFNPQRLEEVEERLRLLQTLKRKYGPTLADVLAFAEHASAELDSISHSEERIVELQAREQALLGEIGRLAGDLSRRRKETAAELSTRTERELAELNMPHVRFEVAVSNTPADDGVAVEGGGQLFAFDATGIDRVEFLISPNPGEPLKPLARVASGGETARVMLALKSILSVADDIPTLIFDEIDVGIGGRSGSVVGEKLWRLTPRHQVLCVTHLPQVAAFGDAHLSVTKQVVAEQTTTAIHELDREQRVQELAAMLGSSTDASLENAREILRLADQRKQGRPS